jgi:hypothetical protein
VFVHRPVSPLCGASEGQEGAQDVWLLMQALARRFPSWSARIAVPSLIGTK